MWFCCNNIRSIVAYAVSILLSIAFIFLCATSNIYVLVRAFVCARDLADITVRVRIQAALFTCNTTKISYKTPMFVEKVGLIFELLGRFNRLKFSFSLLT